MPHLGIGSQAGKLPGAPTSISASQAGGATAVDVAFTAPTHKGKSGTITNYAATASPGGATASGTASPITFNNLSAGTEYNFNVEAVSAIGNTNFTGPGGASSTGYTPVVPNIAVPTEYNTTTTYTPNSYPFAFKVVAIGAGGGSGTQNTAYSRNGGGKWGDINNSLYSGVIGEGSGGSGRVHYVNTTQTINSGTSVMTVGTGGGVQSGASGGATNVYLNQNAANVATGNGGSSGGVAVSGNSNGAPSSTKFNANATSGAGGAGGSGGGTGMVYMIAYNEYGSNKGSTVTTYTNGGTAGNAGGSGGATSNGGALGNGAWTSGAGGAGSGNTGTNANSQIPSGGGNDRATSQITISATNYLTDKGRGGSSNLVSTDGAVLLIPA